MATEAVYLPLRLGEITLGNTCLQLSVDKTHFLENHSPRIPPASQAEGDGHLIRSCPVDAPLPRISMANGYLRYIPRQYLRHYIDLGMGWEAYRQQFSSKSRQTLRRKLKRFARESADGTIDWRTYRRPEEMDAFHALARTVSSVTYQERLLDAGLPDDAAFVDLTRELAAADRIRAYILFLNGAPVAYLYCPIQDGVLLYEYLGYTPDSAHLSPGTVLQWLVLESLFAEGHFRLFDFTAGDSPHKAWFGSGHQACADIYYLKRSIKPVAAALSHTVVTGVSDLASWAVEKLGVKARIKRLLRRA